MGVLEVFEQSSACDSCGGRNFANSERRAQLSIHILDGTLNGRGGDGFLHPMQSIGVIVGMLKEKLGGDAFLEQACRDWVVRERIAAFEVADSQTDAVSQAATMSFGQIDRRRENDWLGGRRSKERGHLAIHTLFSDLPMPARAPAPLPDHLLQRPCHHE